MSAAPAVPQPRIWPMYRALVGVGLLCGALIVGVFEWTRPVIARNRAEALERAIFDVLPDARSSASFRLLREGGVVPATAAGEGRVVHAGYGEDGALTGFAIEARGMGYQDVLHVLYGYAFARDAIIGFRVLESRETPGLGDKIESDSSFLANFRELAVPLAEDDDSLLHPIEYVKQGEKQHPWEIDGITGATISSKAVAGILGESAAFWLPRLRTRLDAFAPPEAPE